MHDTKVKRSRSDNEYVNVQIVWLSYILMQSELVVGWGTFQRRTMQINTYTMHNHNVISFGN